MNANAIKKILVFFGLSLAAVAVIWRVDKLRDMVFSKPDMTSEEDEGKPDG